MFCDRVKEFLSQKGIEFTERDVTVDELAIAELEELGFMTTPVTVIDGEVVVGFDRERLDDLLDG
jgi:glutaredoxin